MTKPKKECDEISEVWFEAALERIKLATGAYTQVQLAEVLGVRQSSISDAKRRCSIPPDWFLKLYRSHGLDPNWISDGREPIYINPAKAKVSPEALLRESPAPYGKPYSRGRIVTVSSSAGAKPESPRWISQPSEELCIPESFYRDELQVVRMDNQSMEPLILRNAFVGIDTNQKQHPDGDLCAVYFQHQGLLVRRVYCQNNTFILRAENQNYTEITISAEEMQSHILGRVLWVLQNFAPL